MDWDQLRTVLAVHREGTLVGAGKALEVNHTTVGRRLKALEGELGVRIFDRTPDGLRATGAGLDLAEVAEGMEAQVLAVENRVLGRDAVLEGSLRVSTLDFLYDGNIDLFASFAQQYPEVKLTVCVTPDPVSLSRREADVVLRLSNGPDEHLVGRKVGSIVFAVYGSRELVEAHGPDATYADYPWIGWDERGDAAPIDAWLEANAPGARTILRVDAIGSMLAAVRGGVGLHFYPCFLGDPDEDLVRIGPIPEGMAADLWLLTHPDLRYTARIQAFMQHMADGLTTRRDLLRGQGAEPPC